MGLRITLKPHERLIINGVSIRNGGRNSDFLIESHCKFLRESEIIHESEANTPCKKLCVTLQVIYLSEHSLEAENLFFLQAVEIMKAIPSAAPFMAEMQNALAEKHPYKAIKIGKKLVAHEEDILKAFEARRIVA